jgi:hypothetical protein
MKYIEILGQDKASFPECHESIVDSKIDILGMSYEEMFLALGVLRILEKIRHTNGLGMATLPEDRQ